VKRKEGLGEGQWGNGGTKMGAGWGGTGRWNIALVVRGIDVPGHVTGDGMHKFHCVIGCMLGVLCV